MATGAVAGSAAGVLRAAFAQARRLVIRGFFGQLIDTIEVPELRVRVATAIEAELEKSL